MTRRRPPPSTTSSLDDEVATAEALVAKRLPSTRGLAYETRVRRLAGMLARKGYGSGLAMRVVRDALAADTGDGDAVAADGPDASADGYGRRTMPTPTSARSRASPRSGAGPGRHRAPGSRPG